MIQGIQKTLIGNGVLHHHFRLAVYGEQQRLTALAQLLEKRSWIGGEIVEGIGVFGSMCHAFLLPHSGQSDQSSLWGIDRLQNRPCGSDLAELPLLNYTAFPEEMALGQSEKATPMGGPGAGTHDVICYATALRHRQP